LEPGEYHVECKEIKPDFSIRPIFLIPKLAGPKDAEIIHGYQTKMMEFNLFVPREKRKEVALSFIITYIDSIFEYFPSSKALPNLLRSATPIIGDDASKNYYSLLSNEQISEPGGVGLANYFKRKEKVKNEIYFQDFEMKDKDGKIFKLSSSDKKLILLDFWSSDCAPCRRNHPKLVELYNRYSDKGLEIISISLDTEKKDWLDAITKDKMMWINLSELKGWETKIAKDYFISSIPHSFLLDQDRKIIATERAFTIEEIEKYLK
jgi:thiol-disulfide isomerase/thioredoxin